MSFKKSKLNILLESQSESNDSYKNKELNQVPSSNNNNYIPYKNKISNSINESNFGDENSICSSEYNPSFLNPFNIPSINELERPTNIVTKDANNKEIISLKNKSLKFAILKLGRKRKTDNLKSEHNKYSDDILRRKVKCIILKNIMKFINEKIKDMYNGNIGYNIFKKQLLTLNGKQNSNAKIKFNQNFLNKKLGDILSENISTKYTNYDANHNKILIKEFLNEKDEKKRLFFNKFFNLTFLQCLKQYRGEEAIDVLNGLTCFNEDKNTIDEDEEYIKILEHYIKTYEKRIMKKKERQKRELPKGKR